MRLYRTQVLNLNVPNDQGWLENCMNCRIPMYHCQLGIEDSVRPNIYSIRMWPLPRNYDAWIKAIEENQRIENIINVGDVWWCKGCKRIWAKGCASQFWVSMDVKTGEEWSTTILFDTSVVDPPLIPETPKPHADKRFPPYPGATMCPQCHQWRDQRRTETGYIYHVCPDCHLGEEVVPQVQGERFVSAKPNTMSVASQKIEAKLKSDSIKQSNSGPV